MHLRLLIRFIAVALTLAPVTSVGAQANARYTVIDVGVLQVKGVELPTPSCSGLRGTVSDINDNGELVGFLPKDETRGNPFYYDGTKMKRLKGESGGGAATALNNDGTIVGVVFREIRSAVCEPGTSPWPAQWVGGKLSSLELPSDATDGYAYDINDSGVIVGSYGTGGGLALPVAWIDGNLVQLSLTFDRDLEEVASYNRAYLLFDSAEATSLDEAGNLYGYGGAPTDDGGFVWYAVKWTAGDLKLTVIGPAGSDVARAGTGFYPAGALVSPAQTTEAIVFSDDGAVILPVPSDLADITDSNANQSSVDGSVIVGRILKESDRIAYLWDNTSGNPETAIPVNLNDIVEDLGSFHLERATGINANGQISIIGRDDATGLSHVLILEPITP